MADARDGLSVIFETTVLRALTSPTILFSMATAMILSRWDLPLPKKPEIHAPLPAELGSL